MAVLFAICLFRCRSGIFRPDGRGQGEGRAGRRLAIGMVLRRSEHARLWARPGPSAARGDRGGTRDAHPLPVSVNTTAPSGRSIPSLPDSHRLGNTTLWGRHAAAKCPDGRRAASEDPLTEPQTRTWAPLGARPVSVSTGAPRGGACISRTGSRAVSGSGPAGRGSGAQRAGDQGTAGRAAGATAGRIRAPGAEDQGFCRPRTRGPTG